MSIHIVVNGKKITNPFITVVVCMLAVLFVGGITVLVFFLVLPLIGVIGSLLIGLAVVTLIGLTVGMPLVLACRVVVGAIMTPFAILKKKLRRKSGQESAHRKNKDQ